MSDLNPPPNEEPEKKEGPSEILVIVVFLAILVAMAFFLPSPSADNPLLP